MVLTILDNSSFYLLIGTFNHSIQVFDAQSYQYTQELRMHFGVVQCLVTSPSGRFLFSASADKCIQVIIPFSNDLAYLLTVTS